MTEVASHLSQLIQLPTVWAHRDDPAAGFDRVAPLLAELYPRVFAELTREDHGPDSIVLKWPGHDADAAPVVLMAHYDVVPVDDQLDAWSVDPFAGTIQDGAVWGRGALDDKGALIVILEAVEALLADGVTPTRTVYLAFGGDEEVLGKTGRRIAEDFQAKGVVPWLVLDEGGAVTEVPFPGVKGLYALIGLAEKGVVNIELRTTGEGGHASAPPKLTAVGRIARAIARLNSNPFAPHMPDTAVAMFAALAPHASTPVARKLIESAAKAPRVTERALLALGGEAAAMVRTTLAPTTLSGGTGINVLPSQAVAGLNLRLNIGESVESARRRVVQAIGDKRVTVEAADGYDPTPESPTDNTQFALLRDAVAVAYPDAPTVGYLTMAATDSRHWHRFAPAVYRFSPLAMTCAERATVHGVDEHVAVDALERGISFYRALLTTLPS